MRRRSLLQGIGGLVGALLLGKAPESTALALPAAVPLAVPPVVPPVGAPALPLATERICLKKFAGSITLSDAALLDQEIARISRRTAIDMTNQALERLLNGPSD